MSAYPLHTDWLRFRHIIIKKNIESSLIESPLPNLLYQMLKQFSQIDSSDVSCRFCSIRHYGLNGLKRCKLSVLESVTLGMNLGHASPVGLSIYAAM